MTKFYLPGNELHPTVSLDAETGIFTIEGKSVPADGKEFYDPILHWLDSYMQDPREFTHLTFNLEYFNISSSKMLLFILYKLNEMKSSGHQVKVSWKYNDEDDEMYEVGEDYAYMVDIPFEFIPDQIQLRPRAS